MKKYLMCSCLMAAMVIVGCSATVTRDYPPVKDSTTGSDAGGAVEDRAPDEVIVPPQQPDAETATPQQPLVNPAVTSLINQARAQYNARNYPAAIATAERGLRIDRRTPELYLVLAQSYLQQSNPQQAQQFVQQGLRFAQPGSPAAESLNRVQDILKGGDF